MKLSPITKRQASDILKAALYVGVSAMLDYLISITTGSEFGRLTVPINILLVTLKKAFTKG